ncbi:MAG TPA: right-handed parallel beta-helix repeat-containing protein, partial [Polyangia bacterium]|nr:right-handed parallel beta-helix repeat-containing protein [Polyangia bacterium]
DIQIRAVRFDGNRRTLGARDGQIPVELGRGMGYVVDGCRFTDSPGWTHLHLIEPCDGSTVTNNVVESADRPHDDDGHETDGLSISCAHTLVSGNHVNDISAVGIVYFGGPGSTISDNVITETTTSAFSGINIGDAIVPDNTGVTISGNQIVALEPRYFHVGLNAGLRVLDKPTVSDVAVHDNTIKGMARYGLAVDGCLDCTIDGNDVSGWQPLPPLASCPAPAAYIAAKTAGEATGTLQPGFVDAKIDNCEGEAEALGDVFRVYAGDVVYPDYLAFEVQLYSERLEQKMDAAGLLRMEWDGLETRAKAMCPATAAAADVQSVWRRIAAAQYGMMLAPADADAQVRADLTSAPAGTPCSPPAP